MPFLIIPLQAAADPGGGMVFPLKIGKVEVQSVQAGPEEQGPTAILRHWRRFAIDQDPSQHHLRPGTTIWGGADLLTMSQEGCQGGEGAQENGLGSQDVQSNSSGENSEAAIHPLQRFPKVPRLLDSQ